MERFERSSTHRRVQEVAAKNPSFSSSLLDAIYQSIDKDEGNDHCKGENRVRKGENRVPVNRQRRGLSINTTTTMEMKKQVTSTVEIKKQIAATTLTDKIVLGQSDYKPQQHQRKEREQSCVFNTNSSSSESSYGEGELLSLDVKKQKQKQKQKHDNSNSIGNRFSAWKIYREMKKAKNSPVSPGGRLVSFINQLFTSASHPKKVKTSSQDVETVGGGGDASTCSSASSYSRSCLSKTPPSTTKSGNRSVKFYPEDVGQGLIHTHEVKDLPLLPPPLPAARVRDPAAEELVRELIFNGKNRALDVSFEEDDDEEEREDAASYSSSDLFELENFTVIEGVDGELPVFETTETTHLHTTAIAPSLRGRLIV